MTEIDVITDAGKAVNFNPNHIATGFYVRANRVADVKKLAERVRNCAGGRCSEIRDVSSIRMGATFWFALFFHVGNTDKNTLRSACYAWQPCMQGNL